MESDGQRHDGHPSNLPVGGEKPSLADLVSRPWDWHRFCPYAALMPSATLLVLLLLSLGATGCNSQCRGREIWSCEDVDDWSAACSWRRVQTCEVACVSSNSGVFCALDDKPDPRCPPDTDKDSSTSVLRCDGDELIDCWEGYLRTSTRCEVFCVATTRSYPSALCALEPVPIWQCENNIWNCRDGEQVTCDTGFVVELSLIHI